LPLFDSHNSVNNSTPVDTAKIFVEALIDGDNEKMNLINRSGEWNFPTDNLMSSSSAKYGKYSTCVIECTILWNINFWVYLNIA